MAKPEGWLPAQEATSNAAGRPTLKKRSAMSLNVLCGGTLASEVLRLVKLTFTRAPSIATVRITVVQSGVVRPIFQGRFDRDRPRRLDTGSTDRETLLKAISTADEVRINNHNRTHEFKPIATEASPSSGARLSATSQRQRVEQFVDELLARMGRAGHDGPIVLRADSGFQNHKLMRTLHAQGVEFSIAVKRLCARGLASVGEGSIYPVLGRLEREGLVETHRPASNGGPPGGTTAPRARGGRR